jgi:hypothetical protein
MLVSYAKGLLAPRPNSKLEEPPLVDCPRLLIQYVCSYCPCLKVVSSIRSLKTYNAVMSRVPLTCIFHDAVVSAMILTAPVKRKSVVIISRKLFCSIIYNINFFFYLAEGLTNDSDFPVRLSEDSSALWTLSYSQFSIRKTTPSLLFN